MGKWHLFSFHSQRPNWDFTNKVSDYILRVGIWKTSTGQNLGEPGTWPIHLCSASCWHLWPNPAAFLKCPLFLCRHSSCSFCLLAAALSRRLTQGPSRKSSRFWIHRRWVAHLEPLCIGCEPALMETFAFLFWFVFVCFCFLSLTVREDI